MTVGGSVTVRVVAAVVHTAPKLVHVGQDPAARPDRDALWLQFLSLTNGIPGLTVLTSQRFDFPGGAMSGTVIIAESHAAIHTWPEHGLAWVSLSSCGSPESVAEWQRRVEKAWPLAKPWGRIVP